jgi:NADH-quinone oxidoreductase subunit M
VLLSAVYMLWMFQRVNYGSVTNEKNAALPDLSTRERFALWPAVAMAIVMGVFPMIFLRPMEPSVARLVEHVRRHEGQTVRRFSSELRAASFESPSPTRQSQPQSPIPNPQSLGLGGAR